MDPIACCPDSDLGCRCGHCCGFDSLRTEMTSLRTLDQADVRGKRVLVRADFNAPVENGRVTDATRIARAAPPIREVADSGGNVMLLSPFRRPNRRAPPPSPRPPVPP